MAYIKYVVFHRFNKVEPKVIDFVERHWVPNNKDRKRQMWLLNKIKSLNNYENKV